MSVLHIFKKYSGRIYKISIDADDYIQLGAPSLHLLRVYPKTPKYITVRLRNGEYLSRAVLNYTGSLQVDHIDRNALNNCKRNLRTATRQQNCANRKARSDSKHSMFKGVSYKPNKSIPWRARIRVGTKTKEKLFKTEKEAALQYNKWAIELHGEFAVLNDV